MTQTHLDHKQYNQLLHTSNKSNCYHVIVLDCGIAGIIRYFKLEQDVYYEDALITNCCLYKKALKKQSFEDIHAEIYQKLALINHMYS